MKKEICPENRVVPNGLVPATTDLLIITFKSLVILFITIAVFLQDLILLFENAVVYEATSYILIIPFIFTYLIYRKRKMIISSIAMKSKMLINFFSYDSMYGILLLLSSLLIYWYGSSTFSPIQYHIIALSMFVAACILILFNIETVKQLTFPLIFLLLFIPPPGEILYRLGGLFSWASANLAYNILKIFNFSVTFSIEYGMPAISVPQPDGTIIPFVVDLACSGIYSQIGFFVFAFFMAYIVRGKHWKKLLIFFIGFPLIYLLNVLRVFSIILIALYLGADLALEMFHLLGGWVLIFLGTLLMLIISEKVFKLQILTGNKRPCSRHKIENTERKSFCVTCGRIQQIRLDKNTRINLLKIGGLIATVILIVSVQTPIFALTKGPEGETLENSAWEQGTTSILPQIPGYTLTFVRRDYDFEQEANLDYALIYSYIANNNTKKIYIMLEIATAQVVLHGWYTCLSLWQIEHGFEPLVETIEWNDNVELLENPVLKANFFVFWPPEPYKKEWPLREETNQAVLYWYEISSFQIDSSVEQKKVKLSLVRYPKKTEPIQQTEEELVVFAKAIVNYWQPIKTWSNIMQPISKTGNYLFMISIAILSTLVLYQILNEKRRKQKNLNMYQKLAEDNQKIINAVQQAESNPTLANIATVYENLYSKSINQKDLLNKLLSMLKVGIIEERIINVQDEPILGWKILLSLHEGGSNR